MELSKKKISNLIRHDRGVGVDTVGADVVRLGVSLLFIVSGIYLNLTTGTGTGSSFASFFTITKPSSSVHVIFQAVPDSHSHSHSNNENHNSFQGILEPPKDGIHTSTTIEYRTFSSEQRKQSIQSLGNKCLPNETANASTSSNPVFEKYNDIGQWASIQALNGNIQQQKQLLAMQIELWKFCMIGSGDEFGHRSGIGSGSGRAHTFVDHYGMHFLDSLDRVLGFESDENEMANYVIVVGANGSGGGSNDNSSSDNSNGNSSGNSNDTDELNHDSDGHEQVYEHEDSYVTTALISLGRNEKGIDVAQSIVESLIMTSNDQLSDPGSGLWLSKLLYTKIREVADVHPDQFVFLESRCYGLHVLKSRNRNSDWKWDWDGNKDKRHSNAFENIGSCALDGQSPCCQVTRKRDHTRRDSNSNANANEETNEQEQVQVQVPEVLMLMEHPMIDASSQYDDLHQEGRAPADGHGSYVSIIETIQFDQDVDTVSTTQTQTQDGSNTNHNRMTQRAFDIFLENDCLPSWQCLTCFSRNRPDDDTRPPCDACATLCKCYCQNICRIRPEQNRITKEFIVDPPRLRKDANRFIPRIIHQTYFEDITKEAYPNFSKLVSSWKYSGWEYNFYDDEASEEFLDRHFAPEVREAYESILPGAYKADLFRLCVLLIEGGIYSDVDVELTSDLDQLIEDDIGFIIPVDEPGRDSGNGSCMWNGMIAAAPGHPFIAKALEMIVNQIRNRFTGVDIDNMLCPNVALDHSHSWDLLFLTGPCVIGAAMNVVLGRHMQSEIIPGDLDTVALGGDIPGRSIILSQNKEDMGWHRFTWLEKNTIVAGTDMPEYDDRADQKHYSDKPQAIKMALFGTKNVYKDFVSKNEDIKMSIRVD